MFPTNVQIRQPINHFHKNRMCCSWLSNMKCFQMFWFRVKFQCMILKFGFLSYFSLCHRLQYIQHENWSDWKLQKRDRDNQNGFVMSTNAMIASIDQQMSNEHCLPLSIAFNIHPTSLRRNVESSLPKTSVKKQRNTNASTLISLRFKRQTKWIHRHHRQTVLSRKSQWLSVGCIQNYIAILYSLICYSSI